MADHAAQESPSDFAQKSSTFIEWFSAYEGARLTSNIQLVDLRSQNEGRGVGMQYSQAPKNILD